ncbi:5'-3' exonuclease [Dioscorea cayenensis subsp. rotundata]|uniref:5'-3' exonuclease n=1 Tax=Dioscorea cayennensis subsp. rotundata TaxID=55577 RepID=A0AB40AZT0_DIOCR|nr:5'-3' exonuclease [Dioscorea cayenensis subsp. rotundata]
MEMDERKKMEKREQRNRRHGSTAFFVMLDYLSLLIFFCFLCYFVSKIWIRYIYRAKLVKVKGRMLTMTLEPARALCSVTSASRNTSLRFCIPPARLAVAAHRVPHGVGASQRNLNKHLLGSSKPRVFLLDVNPLCYEGSKPSLSSFARWLSLFFTEVSLQDPVIAVLDGEEGNEYRRMLMPSYKAHRRKFLRAMNAGQSSNSSEAQVTDVLQKCHVPVIKVNGYEADDVVATLMDQVLQRGFRVVIGSPDKDFKQLISEDVQMVMPLQEFGRWSFYTLKHYIAQYNSDPSSDLSLRCLIGDEVDGVPGIQHVAPSFGRKTAQKLLKKHGSLPNLLAAAAIRTVGKQYVQEALNKHADYLRKNYDVLSLRRDAAVHLQEEWLLKRDPSNDSTVLASNFIQRPGKLHNFDVT